MNPDVTVAVDGLLAPTTGPLPAALTLLHDTIRTLPLGARQYDAVVAIIGPTQIDRVERMLTDAQIEMPLRPAEGEETSARIWRGEWTSPAQRVAARYLVVQQPVTKDCPAGRWSVRDLDAGELVRDVEGRVLVYGLRRLAEDWVRSCMHLAPGASRGQG